MEIKPKDLIKKLGFTPKENTSDIFQKKYSACAGYVIEIDFKNEKINYGKLIVAEKKTTLNFSQQENWVVLECVDRLLTKGYQPKNIIIEKTWPSGHGTSGRLDILVTKNDGSAYLMIECKTWGAEFEKEFKKIQKDGGQLFTYFQQDKNAEILMLYASGLDKNEIKYRNEIIKIEEDYKQAGNVKDFYERWNKLPKSNGVFDKWVEPYEFQSKALTKKDLKALRQEDSSFIFNRFLEILRHHVVSDKPNAFNKIFTLFLCKIVDEDRNSDEQLHFQWIEGEDNHISFQKRLADLYNRGMLELLEKKVTDVSDSEFDKQFEQVESQYKERFKEILTEIRLKKNNEFAIKEVYDDTSFQENAKVVKEVVELLQEYQIRYNYRQQFLSDFFELLLTTGLKQESGQFFTPVPVARFIIKSLPLPEITELKMQNGNKTDLLPVIMDYAAGSGHFITESMEEVQKYIDSTDEKKYSPATQRALKKWKEDQFDWAEDYVYAIEKDYRLVKTAKVSCYLHGDGLAKVIHGDGIGDFATSSEFKDLLKITDRTYPQDNKQFDIIISNPPYSVSAFKGTMMSEEKARKAFDLYSRLTDQSSEIECLFIERTKQLLKDGGVAGIILPSSILSNTGIYSQAREIILNYFEIISITELGSGTFMATGTNTVVLFLRRRNNADSLNLRAAINKFFVNYQDVTINGIEKPVKKYLAHVWESISLEDYVTLLKKNPNKKIQQHDLFKDYDKKIRAKNEQEKWDNILRLEQEKLFYFILSYPQKLVLIKSGDKNDEKDFLGYEFSNRRGSEGIHPIQRDKTIDECTQLYDANISDNPDKASTYIYKAFKGDFKTKIANSMQKNIYYSNLVDMLTFDGVEFEKGISLSIKKKVKSKSKWPFVKIGDVAEILNGGTPDTKNKKYWDGDINWATLVDTKNKYLYSTERKITLAGVKHSSAVILPINTVIFSSRATIGDVCINKVETCTNQGYKNFVCNPDEITHEYLYYILKKEASNIESLASGMTYAEISKTQIADYKIPHPPIDVQKKIVSEIEVLEKMELKSKEKIQKHKEKIDYLIQGLNKFKKITLDQISDNLDNKRKPVTKGHRAKGEIPYYGASGIVDYVSEYLLDDYVLLISEDGANLKSRVSPIAFTASGKIWVNNHAHILKFKNVETHKLVELYLNKIDISEFVTGQAQPKLNQQNLNRIKIPLPPLPEQKKIVSQIDKIIGEINELEKLIKKIPEQVSAILIKYLE